MAFSAAGIDNVNFGQSWDAVAGIINSSADTWALLVPERLPSYWWTRCGSCNCGGKQVALSQLVYAWALSKGEDIIPLIGVSRLTQFQETVGKQADGLPPRINSVFQSNVSAIKNAARQRRALSRGRRASGRGGDKQGIHFGAAEDRVISSSFSRRSGFQQVC